MKEFLRQVAEHYYAGAPDAGRLCFVFPSKRAIGFFKKYLGEQVARLGKAMPAPECFTMNEFFCRITGSHKADRIQQLLLLHECYSSLRENAEPLDDFLYWGGVMLSDFEDVDKYLADPEKLWRNVGEFKDMQDFSFLDPGQEAAIKEFLGQFRKSGPVKEDFLQIWNLLLPLYRKFGRRLAEEGLAYEGGIYRRLAEELDSESVTDILGRCFEPGTRFVFTGLNALNECEKKLLGRMKKAGVAEFCWDFCSAEIRDPQNKSSFFMAQNIERFGQSLPDDCSDGLSVGGTLSSASLLHGRGWLQRGAASPDGSIPEGASDNGKAEGVSAGTASLPNTNAGTADGPAGSSEAPNNPGGVPNGPDSTAEAPGNPGSRPEINVLSVPSAIGQAKQLPEILARIGAPHDIRTAIVLPDEGLLVPVLNSIPADIGDINVTMGYPMKGSEWLGLISLLGALRLNSRETPAGTAFYHRQVWAIFSNGVFQSCLSEEERERTGRIKAEAKFYIPEEDLSAGPLTKAIFHKGESNAEYLKTIILLLAESLRGNPSKAMELEFAMHSWKALQRLSELAPPVSDKTWWKLLGQLLSGEAVPFKGEPLRGMQIMGPLETRTLDFENLIILSCNEGMFPRRAVASSFIPPELRKGFGLPTYEYQDAIWAYYFYRLIQRARKVWLLVDSRTEISRSGEESRYIKQLEMLYAFNVRRFTASSPIRGEQIPDSIPKTQEHLDRMARPDFHLSASSLREYLGCEAKFYYSAVEKLRETDEIKESLDAGMLGSALHGTMHALYSSNPGEDDEKKLLPLESVSKGYIKGLLADSGAIREQVRRRIRLQLGGSPEVLGRNLVYEEIICKYVGRILESDLELLERKGVPSFRILGLEQFRKTRIGGFEFVGYIDRIDSFEPGTLRVVDYKTGHVTDEEMELSPANAGKVVAELFKPDSRKRPGIALQIYLYDRMMEPERNGRLLLNSIYNTRRLFIEGVKENPSCKEFAEALEPPLLETLDSIRDLSRPWRRTKEAKDCEYCDFRKICGR